MSNILPGLLKNLFVLLLQYFGIDVQFIRKCFGNVFMLECTYFKFYSHCNIPLSFNLFVLSVKMGFAFHRQFLILFIHIGRRVIYHVWRWNPLFFKRSIFAL